LIALGEIRGDNSTRGQKLKDSPYVYFRAACDTYMKIRQMKVDELLHKLKNPIAM
jgi:hypothetical protein